MKPEKIVTHYIVRHVNTQAVTLLIGNYLRVRTPCLVQTGVRPPQYGEVNPVEPQWSQSPVNTAAEDIVR